MRVLLDTHVLLWWMSEPDRLSARALDVVGDPSSVVQVSAASLWEISIKEALGRLRIDGIDLVDEIEIEGFLELPVRGRHALDAGRLPRHHDDPFDRMLVAQARAEDLVLVTADRALSEYDVPILKA